MAKITLKNAQTIKDAFEDFIFYKNTQGLSKSRMIITGQRKKSSHSS